MTKFGYGERMDKMEIDDDDDGGDDDDTTNRMRGIPHLSKHDEARVHDEDALSHYQKGVVDL